jgi:hypothetical protein
MKPLYALLILVVLFAAVTAVSWQMWANPVIDGGREMNTPLRLLHGESLYSQVYYLYGPAAPLFNALLYKLFGIHLNTLYAAGLAGSLLLVLVIFYLGKKFMTTVEALLAGIAVILFSIFKQGGNLIFPYSYAALYGTLLGTLALIVLADYVRSHRMRSLTAAGVLFGFALCCKMEFGFAGIVTLLVLAISEPKGQRARIAGISLGFFAIVPVLIYGSLLSKIPIDSIIKDTFILPGHIPEELVYYNKAKLGLNHPGRTMHELISALALIGSLIGLISLTGIRMAGESIAFIRSNRNVRRIWWLIIASLGLILANVLLFGTHWDLNPFRALPVLFLILIVLCIQPRDGRGELEPSRRLLLLVSAYSLAVLARVVIRVPAGGAYGGGLIPVPLLLFIYMAFAGLPSFAMSSAALYQRRRAVLFLLSLAMVVGLGVFTYRQAKPDLIKLQTPRGDLRLRPPLGLAMSQALQFISQNSRPGDYIATFPEGSSMNFLSDRPTPLRYEIATPGFLTKAAEQQTIQRIQEKNVPFIFLFNRPTSEFGPKAFGRDYCRTLMDWIEVNYTLAAVFGEQVLPQVQIGDPSFFIKCYRRKTP